MSSQSMDGRLTTDWLEKQSSGAGDCTVVLLWLPPRWPQSAADPAVPLYRLLYPHCCCCWLVAVVVVVTKSVVAVAAWRIVT